MFAYEIQKVAKDILAFRSSKTQMPLIHGQNKLAYQNYTNWTPKAARCSNWSHDACWSLASK